MVKSNKNISQTLSGSPQSQFIDFAPKAVISTRAPTALDTGYEIGQEWIHEGNAAYILIQVAGGSATWEATGGSVTALATLTGNSGVATPVASNINVIGVTAQGLSFTGSAGQLQGTISDGTTTQKGVLETATDAEAAALTSTTVAITPSNLPQIMASQFIVGPVNAPYTTIQAAITAAEATGIPQAILVRPGSYSENLVFTNGRITIVGLAADGQTGTSGNNCIVNIDGMHTPPLTGHLSFSNAFMNGGFDIIHTTDPGTTSISFQNCHFNNVSGYICSLPSWTGLIKILNCTDLSTHNGVIENSTGGSSIQILNSIVGNGTDLTMATRGSVIIQNSEIRCPISYQTGTSVAIDSCKFTKNTTFANNSSGYLQSCFFDTGATQAITKNSTGIVSLFNSAINCSNNPAIGGVSGFSLNMSSVTFLDNINIAGTVTLAVDLFRGGNILSQFVVGSAPDAQYQTVQSALDAANAAGGGVVFIKGGVAVTENLTLYDNTQIIGLSGNGEIANFINIDGTHTPPASGEFFFSNVQLSSSTDIFNSSSAGSANLVLINCIVTVMNGYTFNLPNWTGTLQSTGCLMTGTNNGEINNQGAAFISYKNTEFGNGTSNTADFNGTAFFDNVTFRCPVLVADTSSAQFTGGCLAYQQITTADTSQTYFYDMTFITGESPALNVTSFGLTRLSDVTIDSQSATFAIDGDVNGTITMGSVTFIDNASIEPNISIEGFAGTTQHRIFNSFIHGGQAVGYTDVTASPWAVNNTDYFLSVDTSGGAVTVTLPDPNYQGAIFVVKDRTGDAGANNISVTTSGGMATIDGATTYTMNQNYASFSFLDNATSYEVF